jgi:hypothetical protein
VYSNDSPGETGGNGWGGNVGIGYDYFLRKGYKRDWYLTPSIDYAVGSIQGATKPAGVTQDQHYWALTARLGLTFR